MITVKLGELSEARILNLLEYNTVTGYYNHVDGGEARGGGGRAGGV